MAQTITLCDEYGIIHEAIKILPDDELKIIVLEALQVLQLPESPHHYPAHLRTGIGDPSKTHIVFHAANQ
nr:hypothetical protein [Microcoleus sp. CAWBG58]